MRNGNLKVGTLHFSTNSLNVMWKHQMNKAEDHFKTQSRERIKARFFKKIKIQVPTSMTNWESVINSLRWFEVMLKLPTYNTKLKLTTRSVVADNMILRILKRQANLLISKLAYNTTKAFKAKNKLITQITIYLLVLHTKSQFRLCCRRT